MLEFRAPSKYRDERCGNFHIKKVQKYVSCSGSRLNNSTKLGDVFQIDE